MIQGKLEMFFDVEEVAVSNCEHLNFGLVFTSASESKTSLDQI